MKTIDDLDVAGRRQLITPGSKALMAYDPQTGAELWKVRYNGWSMVPTRCTRA